MGKHALAGNEAFVKRGGEVFLCDPRYLVVEDGVNPREYGDEQDQDFKENIRQNGVLDPIKVQKVDDESLIIWDGHRRHWACMELISCGEDVKTVPVKLVDKKAGESERLFTMLNSNTGRPFSPLGEAELFRRLKSLGFSPEEISKRIGKSVATIYERLRLVNASAETREAIKNGTVGPSVASKAISSAGGDADKQKQAIKRYSAPKVHVVFQKKTKSIFVKGELNQDRTSIMADIFNTEVLQRMESAGLDPTTIKFSISVKS